MLSLKTISKRFGGLQVLQNVTMTVPQRGIFGLIGPNGAGKTTVFNLITGLLKPDEGTIDLSGRQLVGLAPYQITRAGVARTFQNIRIFKEMSLLENVLVAREPASYRAAIALLPSRRFHRARQREHEFAYELLSRVGLAEKAKFVAGKLSYGDQRRLEIARALATQPKLLLLDEPAAGMNTVEKQQLMDEIVKLDENGLSLLIIEHDMRFIMGLCSQIIVLNFGQVIARGTPDDIRNNDDVIAAYLGRDGENDLAPPDGPL